MQRLVYISTARTAPDPTMLEDILRVSRWNNAAAGITGLLVAGGRRYLQAIEGPKEAVDRVYARISRDPRHFDLIELAREPIEARAFPDWSMGHVTGGEAGGSGTVPEAIKALIRPIDDPMSRTYFTGFAKLEAR